MNANPFTPGRRVWRDVLTDRPANVPADAPFWCHRGCGAWWRADPRLAVACPTCGAPVASPCKRPSEHTVWRGGTQAVHTARRKLAWAHDPCRCAALWEAARNDAAAPVAPITTDLDLFGEGA